MALHDGQQRRRRNCKNCGKWLQFGDDERCRDCDPECSECNERASQCGGLNDAGACVECVKFAIEETP